MPGPCNSTRKRTKAKSSRSKPRLSFESTSSSNTSWSHIRTPSPVLSVSVPRVAGQESGSSFGGDDPCSSAVLPPKPFIHDPGNGHRVRDMPAFLSSFFAQSPSLDDPLCAEFSQNEVLQMLCTVLPEETALILWYNKSRSTSRICPACQRLYRLGDVLPDHTDEDSSRFDLSPQLEREQSISGLCSALCFILASYNYPAAIKSAWGHMAEEMDEDAWTRLNSSGDGNADSPVSIGLGMLVRMTRLHDLGLAQLCLPDLEFEEAIYSDCEDAFFQI
ncbi:hypothetical protein GGX14DRAFT_351999 [Mycena pura]|uniref:Uncharacterized protein n=1 Tax=Mycena pura TaxID=153505 RepID=A0AAD6YLU3_9AGAR|nr:hypothetical protein GGX14DRAFT_351999 [Mycena pura]